MLLSTREGSQLHKIGREIRTERSNRKWSGSNMINPARHPGPTCKPSFSVPVYPAAMFSTADTKGTGKCKCNLNRPRLPDNSSFLFLSYKTVASRCFSGLCMLSLRHHSGFRSKSLPPCPSRLIASRNYARFRRPVLVSTRRTVTK